MAEPGMTNDGFASLKSEILILIDVYIPLFSLTLPASRAIDIIMETSQQWPDTACGGTVLHLAQAAFGGGAFAFNTPIVHLGLRSVRVAPPSNMTGSKGRLDA